jgi:hypothetical protein
MAPRPESKHGRSLLTASLATLVLLGSTLAAVAGGRASDPARSAPAENKYIGADKCKSCHGAAESGDVHSKWKATAHAKAFETLASEEAKKLAAEKGIADPQKADECVSCHVTAFGVAEAQIKKGFDRAHGVQCEACHGPGENHMKARFAAAAKGDAPKGHVEVPAGEIVARPTVETCVACHNEKSPSYKPFCFHEFNAKIRHLDPRKPRTEVDIGTCPCPKCANGCSEECQKLKALK